MGQRSAPYSGRPAIHHPVKGDEPRIKQVNTVPFGFWCGGFSSTAGYVPGNEAQLSLSGFCYPQG
jgi:hypothetical protein